MHAYANIMIQSKCSLTGPSCVQPIEAQQRESLPLGGAAASQRGSSRLVFSSGFGGQLNVALRARHRCRRHPDGGTSPLGCRSGAQPDQSLSFSQVRGSRLTTLWRLFCPSRQWHAVRCRVTGSTQSRAESGWQGLALAVRNGLQPSRSSSSGRTSRSCRRGTVT
jgi:hypothetical protein